MKSICSFSLLLLCLILAPITLTQADGPEPFARGKVRVSFADGATRYVEFSAKLHDNGSTTGQMMFTSPMETQDQDVDGTNVEQDGSGTKSVPGSSEFYFKADFDCMVVDGTRAVMSGTVNESSSARYLGQRVLLIVQDKGDDKKSTSADKLSWGLYRPTLNAWIPGDSELESDKGVGLTWLATDAERDDDAGRSSDKSEFIGCQSFPISSFSLVKVKNGDGNIEVRPVEPNQPK